MREEFAKYLSDLEDDIIKFLWQQNRLNTNDNNSRQLAELENKIPPREEYIFHLNVKMFDESGLKFREGGYLDQPALFLAQGTACRRAINRFKNEKAAVEAFNARS